MSPEADPSKRLAGLSHLFLSRPRVDAGEGAVPHPRQRDEPLFIGGGADALLPALVALHMADEYARAGQRPVVVDADHALPLVRLLSARSASRDADDRVAYAESVRDALDCDRRPILAAVTGRLLLPPSAPAGISRLLLVLTPEPAEVARAYAAIKRTHALNDPLWVGIAWREIRADERERETIRGFQRLLQQRGWPAVDCGRIPAAMGRPGRVLRPPPEGERRWCAEIARAVEPPSACEAGGGAESDTGGETNGEANGKTRGETNGTDLRRWGISEAEEAEVRGLFS